jgi:glucose-6-phosphate 1-epimerase
MIEDLNRTYGIEGQLFFESGVGGLPRVVISNALSSAEVYLHGAHVTAFRPRGAESVLWLSDIADFRPGRPIRGGIPVCWPWFGPHPTGGSLPQHGFARLSDWGVTGTRASPDGRTELRLLLEDDEDTRALWPHPFSLELRVVVGEALEVELTTRNVGPDVVAIGGALHTYFRVADINRVSVDGLAGCNYIDKVDGCRIKRQEGLISFCGEVDRVYLDAPGDCVIDDAALGRRIHVGKNGSRTTVVWNPWANRSKGMADFPDEGYRTMVCVEATNAESDVYSVPPGGEHTLSQVIAVRRDL